MTTTYVDAIGQMYDKFLSEWNAASSAIAGYIPEVRFSGVDLPNVPDASKVWVRLSTQTVESPQSSLRGPDSKRFRTTGLITIQLFIPQSMSQADQVGKKLSDFGVKIFRGQFTIGI